MSHTLTNLLNKLDDFMNRIDDLTIYRIAPYNTDRNAAPLSPEQQFALLLGYIISHHRHFHYNVLTMPIKKAELIKDLSSSWGITDSKSCRHILDYYLKQGDREYFNYINHLYIQTGGDKRVLKKMDDDPDIERHFSKLHTMLRQRYVKRWFPNPAEDLRVTTDAFDIGRMINITRWCYTVGYISEKEAWDYINRFRVMTQERFTNWQDYAKSYLLGRITWDGKRSGEFVEFFRSTRRLLTHKDSPWVKYAWLGQGC